MIQIRPVTDLQNNYNAIEKEVLESDETMYLTKNGYGAMVVLSLEAYSRLTDGVEAALDNADLAAESDEMRYTHDEVFGGIRKRING